MKMELLIILRDNGPKQLKKYMVPFLNEFLERMSKIYIVTVIDNLLTYFTYFHTESLCRFDEGKIEKVDRKLE